MMKPLKKERMHTLLYQSSYDRGLMHALKMWGKIKEKYPDAVFHIAYGWDLFLTFYRNNPERINWMERMEEKMKQPGIVHHGRIGQPDLRKLRDTCGIWFYPTDFNEINCLSALECQASGCVPCVINSAALKETVGSGVKVGGDIYDPEVQDKYLKALLELMGDKDKWTAEQAKGRLFARQFSWKRIAKQWEKLFKK